MLYLFAVSVLAHAQAPTVPDYFPLKPGMSWEYSVTFERNINPLTQVHKILELITIEGLEVTPMEVLVEGEHSGVSYYRSVNGYVSVIALDKDTLLPGPIPTLPIEPKKGQKWEFNGLTFFLGDLTETAIKSRVAGFEKINVLGEERNALKIISNAQIGSGPSALKTESTELYVDGIGLVKRTQSIKMKRGGVTTFTLIRFNRAGD